MRNVIFTLFSAFILLNSVKASAQIVTSFSNHDTAFGYYHGGDEITVNNYLKSGSANPVVLRWNVASYKFPAGYDTVNAGFCDNKNCYSATAATNNLFTNGTIYYSLPYDNTFGDFHMIFKPNNPAVGTTAWVRVFARDTVGNTTRTFTFMAYTAAAGVSTSISSSDDVVLYPNPAREAVNVIFDEKAGVKTIAVYNIIGKLAGPIYKPADNNSARIDLNELPNGVYFLRLMDGQGHVIATRRFIRQ